jgi:hypothetical protein
MVILDGKEHLQEVLVQDIKIHVEVNKVGNLHNLFHQCLIELKNHNKMYLILWINKI